MIKKKKKKFKWYYGKLSVDLHEIWCLAMLSVYLKNVMQEIKYLEHKNTF